MYLGHRHWGFSAAEPQQMVVTCPRKDSAGESYALSLPAVRIFEIPMGCTAQSEDWILQASFRKDRVYDWLAGKKPATLKLAVMDIGSLRVQGGRMEEGEKRIGEGKEDEKGGLTEIVMRNEKAREEVRTLENNMRKVVEEDSRRLEEMESGRYPWEIYGLCSLAFGLLMGYACKVRRQDDQARAGLNQRIGELEARLLIHENAVDIEMERTE